MFSEERQKKLVQILFYAYQNLDGGRQTTAGDEITDFLLNTLEELCGGPYEVQE